MVRQLCQSQEKLQCVFHKQLGCVSKGGPYLLQICTSHLTPALKKGNIQQGQSHHYWNGPDLKSIFSVQKPFCYLSVLTVLVKDLEDSSEITCQRQRFLFKPPLEVGFFLPIKWLKCQRHSTSDIFDMKTVICTTEVLQLWSDSTEQRIALPDQDCLCLKQFTRENGSAISVFTSATFRKGVSNTRPRTQHLFT